MLLRVICTFCVNENMRCVGFLSENHRWAFDKVISFTISCDVVISQHHCHARTSSHECLLSTLPTPMITPVGCPWRACERCWHQWHRRTIADQIGRVIDFKEEIHVLFFFAIGYLGISMNINSHPRELIAPAFVARGSNHAHRGARNRRNNVRNLNNG